MTEPAPAPSESPSPASRRGDWRALLWLLALLALGLGLWQGGLWLRTRMGTAVEEKSLTEVRLDGAEQGLERLRDTVRSLEARVQSANSTNQVLRDELLGIGQRAALLEESVNRLRDPQRQGQRALRLDEAGLLLSLGQQRLELFGDAAGALRAYALADAVLAGVDEAAFADLRQTLAQEQAALRALPADPRARAAGELEALEAALATLATIEGDARAPADDRSTLDRVLGRLVQVRPSGALATPAERDVARAALGIELGLIRAAIERRDDAGLRAGVARIDTWLAKLYPESPALREHRARLAALAERPLTLELPVLGSTLTQLQALRSARAAAVARDEP